MKTLTSNKAFWLLLVICVVTILPFLGLSEYHTKGEPRESIVSYSMLDSGNWILPRNNGGEMATNRLSSTGALLLFRQQ